MNNIIINPGSGKVKRGSRDHSMDNIRQFIKDMALRNPVRYRFLKIDDDGRHSYRLYYGSGNGSRTCDVDMPALPLKEVRWLDSTSGNIFDFPRLYVGGSSWIWYIGVSIAVSDLSSQTYNRREKKEWTIAQ